MNSYNALKGFQLYLLLTAIALAAFLISLDGFIVNVAIPTISGELGVRPDEGTWIITLFSMASTACVPLSATLTRHLGDRRLFIAALLTFSLASCAVGLSHDFELLLAFRVIQGMAAGILTPVSLALIITNFPEEKKSIAVGFWSFFVMVGPAMGPMIGGWLSDYRWPWMFYLNVPVTAFSLLMVTILLKEGKEEHSPLTSDRIGIALLFTWVGATQVAMNRWNIDDWFRSTFITTLFIIAGIAFVMFIIWELYHPCPFMNLRKFKERNFALPSLTTGLGMGLLFSSFVLDSLWVQQVLGYTPAWAGLTLVPVGIFPLIFYPIVGRFAGLLDLRIWVIGSFLLYAATFFWMSGITTYTPFWKIAFPRLIQGIGFAFFTVPNALLTVQGVAKEKLTQTIAFFSFVRMLFVGYGVALAITLWIFRETFYQTRLTERTDPANPLFLNLTTPFEAIADSTLQSYSLAYNTIVNHASTLALADIYYLYAWIFIGLSSLVLFYDTEHHK